MFQPGEFMGIVAMVAPAMLVVGVIVSKFRDLNTRVTNVEKKIDLILVNLQRCSSGAGPETPIGGGRVDG